MISGRKWPQMAKKKSLTKIAMVFWDHLLIITLSCEFRVHGAGSQLKMSECQTKAGNQECFEKLEEIENLSLSQLSISHAVQLLFSCLCSKVTDYR